MFIGSLIFLALCGYLAHAFGGFSGGGSRPVADVSSRRGVRGDASQLIGFNVARVGVGIDVMDSESGIIGLGMGVGTGVGVSFGD